jgi:hypothetical protein
MAYSSSHLPNRFPIGTKFVIEGRRGGEGKVQVSSRYLEFPDGTFLRLPLKPAAQKPVGRRPRRTRAPAPSRAGRKAS